MNQFVYLNSADAEYDSILKRFRFQLPTPITSNNKAISLRLAEAEVPVTYYNVITGVNDTFVFTTKNAINQNVKTYTIVLAEQNYSAIEMVAALNAGIVAEGKTANSITTVITFSEQTLRFTINCTATDAVIKSIDVLESTASQSIGFVVGQTTGDNVTNNLSLVMEHAANLNRTKNCYIMTDEFGLLTRTSTNTSNLTILSKVQMAVPFGSIVSYQNEYAQYIALNKQINYIDHINIYMLDDRREHLHFNNVNFCLFLLFDTNGDISNISTRQSQSMLTQLSM